MSRDSDRDHETPARRLGAGGMPRDASPGAGPPGVITGSDHDRSARLVDSAGIRSTVPAGVAETDRAAIRPPLMDDTALEDVVERFEQAWQTGTPELDDYLAAGRSDLALLHELALVDLEYRVKRGQRPDLDAYAARFGPASARASFVREAEQIRDRLLRRMDSALVGAASRGGRPRDGVDAELAPRPAGDAPARIADYDIIAPIAKGGMGVVYKARQRRLDRLVALKTIRHSDAESADSIRRFQAEAEAAARLDHPGIVPIFEVGEDRGRHFLAMALVDGGSLAARLAAGPLEPRAAAALVRAVADAVAYAHDRGIVHRDLKPSNILLAADGTPKVTDFGLAKQVEADDGLTMSGQVLGTPQYMPPEQARGDIRAVGPRSDVYALGAILYHAITGRPPFTAATAVATLKQVLEVEPVAPRQLNPQVDRDLETIALKCLEKDPARRYTSAAACAADLARHLDGLPIGARPTSPVERTVKWARRRPAAAALVAVSLLMLVSLAVGGLLYAEAATKRAELATRQLREQVALEQTRRDVQAALHAAADLLREQKLAEADGVIREAAARAGDAEPLAAERERLDEVRRELERLRAIDREHTAARDALAAFRRHRDDAIFYGSQSFGLDPRSNQRRAAEAARAGLAVWGLDREGVGRPDAPAEHFAAEERDEIEAQCEELLLVLADAILRSADGATETHAAVAETERAIDRCVSLKGRESRATHLARAESRRLAGDAAGAARERSLAEADAGDETATEQFLVGRMLLQREASSSPQFARAKGEFQGALVADPDHFWAQYCLATHALRSGRPDLADVHLTACIGRRPEFAWPWILRGAARTATGEHALAETDFHKGLELADDQEARHVALVNWAALDFAAGRIEAARGKVREAVAGESRGHQALLTLAAIEKAAGDEAAALGALDEAAALAPDLAIVPRERARLHLLAGRFERAERDLEEAVRLETADPQARAGDLALLGDARFRQGRLDDALDAWDRAVAIDANHAHALLGRATVLIEHGRLDEARDALDAYARTAAASPEFHLTRALCRAHLGDYAGAIADYSAAIETAPSAEALTQRGWLYALRGSPLIGLRDFERAIELEPEHADAHVGRGLALAYLGRHAHAAAAAERALEVGEPSFRHVFKTATVFAAAAPRVVLSDEERKKQGPTERQLGIRYLSRSAELLQQALAHEHPDRHDDLWAAHVEDDPHFKPLLTEPEFRKVRRGVFERDQPQGGDPASPEAGPAAPVAAARPAGASP